VGSCHHKADTAAAGIVEADEKDDCKPVADAGRKGFLVATDANYVSLILTAAGIFEYTKCTELFDHKCSATEADETTT
jgi:hypothetical protein